MNKNIPIEDLENMYEILFRKMLNGFAVHKIITDDKGIPIDYQFVDVNESFEKMTNLKKEDIVGKMVTQIMPSIQNDKAHWIERYGKVALTGNEERFEDYSAPLNKWFNVLAYSPAHGYFATIFEDITQRKNVEITLGKKIEELEKINRLTVERELEMIKLKKEINNQENNK